MLNVENRMQTYKKRKRVKGLAVKDCHALFASETLEKMSDKEKKATFADKDVLMIGYAGLAGTVQIAEKKQQELLSRYPLFFIEQAILQKALLQEIPEAATAMMSGECGILKLSEGGVYQGLWYISELTGVGLEIECKKIPIKQETVEICEFFQLNPYELLSGGSMIMITDNGEALVETLAQANIPATVVGKITEGHDRVVTNEEETRFLDRPRTDEIYKMEELWK